MKRIDPNDAGRLMQKEIENKGFCKQRTKINEDFETLKAFIEVLNGYLTGKSEIGSFDYDKSFLFIHEINLKLESMENDFNKFCQALREAGRMGSFYSDEKTFAKCTTRIERIPMTFELPGYKKTKQEKKAA